jgi:hypothetical protein
MAIPRGVTSSNARAPYKASAAARHHSADDAQYAKSGTPSFYRQSPWRSPRSSFFALLFGNRRRRDGEVGMAKNRHFCLFLSLQATLSLGQATPRGLIRPDPIANS